MSYDLSHYNTSEPFYCDVVRNLTRTLNHTNEIIQQDEAKPGKKSQEEHSLQIKLEETATQLQDALQVLEKSIQEIEDEITELRDQVETVQDYGKAIHIEGPQDQFRNAEQGGKELINILMIKQRKGRMVVHEAEDVLQIVEEQSSTKEGSNDETIYPILPVNDKSESNSMDSNPFIVDNPGYPLPPF